MADQERDRYGEKMKEVERGREDDYFARRDRELIKKMREGKGAEHCPTCGAPLQREEDRQPFCPRCACS